MVAGEPLVARREPPWVGRARKVVAAGLVGGLGALAAAAAGWEHPAGLLGELTSAWWLFTGLGAAAAAIGRGGVYRGASVPVVAEPDALRIGDRRIARGELRSGTLTVVARGDERLVRIDLEHRGGVERLQTDDLRGARRLLEELRLDAAHARVRRRLVSPANHPVVAGPLLLAFLFGPFLADSDVWSPAIWTALAAIAIAVGLVPSRVDLGDDVVRWSWLGLRSVAAVADVERVEIRPAGLVRACTVRLHLRGGRRFDIPLGRRGHNPFEPYSLREEAARVAERVEAAMGAQRPASFRLPPPAVSLAEWIEGLRRGASPDYRGSSGPGAPELERVALDATAEPLLRAGAAAAVAHLEPASRPRLRVAADATALPELREAFDAALEQDDDRVVAALERLRRR